MASKDDKPNSDSSGPNDAGSDPKGAAGKRAAKETAGAVPKTGASARRPGQTLNLKAKEVDETAEGSSKEPGKAEEAKGKAGKAKAGAGKDASPEPMEPPQRTSPREVKGFVTHLAAGLVGGVIGVVGVGIGLNKLSIPGLSPQAQQPDSRSNEALESRLSALEQRVAARADERESGDRVAEAVKAQEERLARLEEEQNSQAGARQEAGERFGKIEQTLKTLGDAAERGGDVAQTAAITARIEELVSRLNDRIDALEQGQPADQEARAAIDALQSEIGQLSRRLDEAANRGEPALPDAAADRLSAIEDAIKRLQNQAAQTTDAAKGSVLSLRVDVLMRAVDSGKPFQGELAALRQVAPADLDLSALEPYAEQAVPTRSALLQSLRAHAVALPAAPPAKEGDSLLGQLLNSAQSVVRVRRTDGTSPGSGKRAVARVIERLEAGDLAAALDDARALPDFAREALETWTAQAKQRLALDQAAAAMQKRLAQLLEQKAAAATQ